MCKPEMRVDAQSVHHDILQQKQLFQLVGTIEHAAQTMLRAAEEETSKKRNEKARRQQPGIVSGSAAPHVLAMDQPCESKLPPASANDHVQLWQQPTHSYEQQHHHEPETGATNQSQSKTPARGQKRRKRSSNSKNKDPDATLKGHKRTFVEHHYHDHSQDQPGSTEDVVQPSSKSRGGVTTPFPVQLHDMLDRAEERGYSNVISWQPHGRAFHIHDPSRFVAEVMPMYFRQTKMASFQRQLSLYGFLRLTRKSDDHGAYYNELFLRGMPHLCHRMQRTRIKGYWVRQSSSPETEPDFSKMPVVGRPGVPAAASGGTNPLNNSMMWPFVSDSGQSSSNSSKVDPSLQMDSSLAGASGGNFPVVQVNAIGLNPQHAASAIQDKIRIPPMPPLKIPAAPGGSHDETLKPPPVSDSLTLQDMVKQALPMPRTGFPQYSQQEQALSNLDPYQAAASHHHHRHSSNPTTGPLELLDLELEQHMMTMSKTEREDMVAFLSDVDLSGDENSVEESYEEEAKIGQVSSSRKRRHVTGV